MYKVRIMVLGTVLFLFSLGMCAYAAQGVVNVNKASKEELMMLPGIGEKTAGNTIAYRQANGQFSSIDNLTRVKGFSKKKLDKIRQYLVLDGQTTYIPGTSSKPTDKTKKSKS
jgi:competence ComEA-like helix-hairpin-helix protein